MKSQGENILKDLNKKGEKRDWRGKKISSLKLSKVYKSISEKIKPEYEKRGVHIRYKQVRRKIKDRIGNITGVIVSEESKGLYDEDGKRVINYEKRAENMKFCGSLLEFAEIAEDRKKLIKANFCRVPLCPMCQWRKSLRVFFDISKIISEVEKRHKNLKYIFLTLTVKNCSLEELGKTLDNMFRAWDRFMRSRTLNPMVDGKIKHIVKGWFRALEVEYDGNEFITEEQYNKAKGYYDKNNIGIGDKNPSFNTFHPHFHAILNVDKNYFKGEDYLNIAEWVQLWRKSAKLDYDPVCWVEKIKNKGNRKDIAEVAKYTFKDAQILHRTLSDDKKADVVGCLSNALYGRRLYAYGGLMKNIAAELKLQEIDKSDLVKVDDDNINPSLVKMITRYRWNVGVSNYVLVMKIDTETGEVEE